MFSGRILTRNAWKLTNNGSETVVHGTKLMTYTWFILFAASAFRKLSSIYVFSYFPFGFEGRIWDLIVSVPDHCLSFYFPATSILNCGSLIITNYLITILICKPFQKFYFKLSLNASQNYYPKKSYRPFSKILFFAISDETVII